jgi:hypothetical protein
MSRSLFLRMRNVSNEICKENKNTFCVPYSFSENHAVYETQWKNTLEPGRPQMTVWRMRILRWVTSATNTHSEYVVLSAFYGNNVSTNASHCYVIRSLPVVFLLESVHSGSEAGRGVNRPGREPDHWLHLVPRLSMSGSILLFPLYAFMVWTGTTLPFKIEKKLFVFCLPLRRFGFDLRSVLMGY